MIEQGDVEKIQVVNRDLAEIYLKKDAADLSLIHICLGLIVICEGDKVLGIVTDGDIRRAMERRESEFFSIRPWTSPRPIPRPSGPMRN